MGSGFVIGKGLIATNHHVIEGAAVGTAKLVGETTAHEIESIRAVDEEHDIAIIVAKGVNAPILPLGDSDAVQVGEKIYVAGNPNGLEGTFSDGIISGIRQESGVKLLQMTAPISAGSSGGPVLNSSGEVIGISVTSRIDGQNLNFAVPINHLKALAATTVNNPLITEIHDFDASSTSVAFRPDGKYIATGSGINVRILWDVSTGELVTAKRANVDNPEKSIWGIDFSPDGKYLAFGAYVDNDEKPIVVIVTPNMEDVVEYFLIPSSITRGEIYSVRFSPDSRYVAVSFSDNSRVLLWNLTNGNYVWWGRRDASRVDSLAFSPDGKYLAAGHNNGTVIFYELSSWWSDNVNETQVEPGGTIYDVAFSTDGNYFAADGYYLDDHNVSIYDTNNMATPSIVHRIDYKEFSPWAIAFSPDDKYLAVGGDDGRISFYETDANFTKVGAILVGGIIADLAWSPDGSLISDGEKVWEITENTESLIPLAPSDSGSQAPDLVLEAARIVPATVAPGETFRLYATLKNQGTAESTATKVRYYRSTDNVISTADTQLGSANRNPLAPNATIRRYLTVTAPTTPGTYYYGVCVDSVTNESDTANNCSAAVTLTVTAPTVVAEDVNEDGVVDVQDLVYVAQRYGQTGTNRADVNGDKVVNIDDLILVAAVLDADAAAAPTLHPAALEGLTVADVKVWLSQARQRDLTDPSVQRGILFLEQLLASMVPKETALLANYPNPFNPETWIPYQLSKPAAVMITIYASNGHVSAAR